MLVVMDRQPTKKEQPFVLYCFGLVLMYLGGSSLLRYSSDGRVFNGKYRFSYTGNEALVVSLVPLAAGLVVLFCALRISWKIFKSRKPDDN